MTEKAPNPKEVSQLVTQYEDFINRLSQRGPTLRHLNELQVNNRRQQIIRSLGIEDLVTVVRGLLPDGGEIPQELRDELINEEFGQTLETYPETRRVLHEIVFGEMPSQQPPVRRSTETFTPPPTDRRAEKLTSGPQIRRLTSKPSGVTEEKQATEPKSAIEFDDQNTTITIEGTAIKLTKMQYAIFKRIARVRRGSIRATQLTPIVHKFNPDSTTSPSHFIIGINQSLALGGINLRIKSEGEKFGRSYHLQSEQQQPTAPSPQARGEKIPTTKTPERKPEFELPSYKECASLVTLLWANNERLAQMGIKSKIPENLYEALTALVPENHDFKQTLTEDERKAIRTMRETSLEKILNILGSDNAERIIDDLVIKKDPRAEIFYYILDAEQQHEKLQLFSRSSVVADGEVVVGRGINFVKKVTIWLEENGHSAPDSKSIFEKLNPADLVKRKAERDKFRKSFPGIESYISDIIKNISEKWGLDRIDITNEEFTSIVNVNLNTLTHFIEENLRTNEPGKRARHTLLSTEEVIFAACGLKLLKDGINEKHNQKILRDIISQKLETTRAAQKKSVKK